MKSEKICYMGLAEKVIYRRYVLRTGYANAEGDNF